MTFLLQMVILKEIHLIKILQKKILLEETCTLTRELMKEICLIEENQKANLKLEIIRSKIQPLSKLITVMRDNPAMIKNSQDLDRLDLDQTLTNDHQDICPDRLDQILISDLQDQALTRQNSMEIKSSQPNLFHRTPDLPDIKEVPLMDKALDHKTETNSQALREETALRKSHSKDPHLRYI